MSIFNSFIAGTKAGKDWKDRQAKDSALLNASAIYAQGGDAGAPLRDVGMLDEANDYDAKAKVKQDQAFNSELGSKINEGDLQGAQTQAFGAGQLDVGGQIQTMRSKMSAEERAKVSETLDWVAQNVPNLRTVAPEKRFDAIKSLLANAGLGESPEAMANLEQAASDGKIDDHELESFRRSALSIGEQFKVERGERQDAEAKRHNEGMEKRPYYGRGGGGSDDEDFPDEIVP